MYVYLNIEFLDVNEETKMLSSRQDEGYFPKSIFKCCYVT